MSSDKLAQAWDEAADGYEQYFVPRFAPWVDAAVQALAEVTLPPGPILVPCCGTFPELPALANSYPDREIVGIDLSAGMIALARKRAAGMPQVRLIVGDAATLDQQWRGECAAVVSVFGVQQLPDPVAALTDWAMALRPGGRLSVMYWPGQVEQDGPFALLDRALADLRKPSDRSWEHELAAAVTAAGAIVSRDELRPYDMSHADAATFWAAMVDSGPLRAMANRQGSQVMELVAERFLGMAPAGPLHHRPQARFLVADAVCANR